MTKHFNMVGMAVLLWMAVSCTPEIKNIPIEKYQVTHPVQTDTSYVSEYVGEIRSIQNVEIRSRLNGYLEQVLVDEGEEVRSGQVLFTINSSVYQQQLLSAKATLKSVLTELKSAELELDNVKSLHAKNIASDTELEVAAAQAEGLKAKMEESETAVELAQLMLSFTQVKAPFDGIINRIPNKKGSLVEEGTLLTTISDNKDMFVYFSVSERDYLDYVMDAKKNQEQIVSLVLANDKVYPQKGRIETVEGEIDPSTGNIAFRARFSNPDHILRHGGTGKILLRNALHNALLIPQKSTFDRQENLCVFVVDSDSIVRVRNIVPQVRLPRLFAVSSGLSPHDKIIYEGVQLVKEGDKILPEVVSFLDGLNQ